jgi:transposase, IS30 family
LGGLEEVALRGVKIAPEVRREVLRLRGQGLAISQIVARVDVSQGAVAAMLRPLGGVIRKDMLTVSGRRLSLAERVEIGIGLERGWSLRRIGAQLGRAASTICREVAAGGGRGSYRPVAAQERAVAAARRPHARQLAAPPPWPPVTQIREPRW